MKKLALSMLILSIMALPSLFAGGGKEKTAAESYDYVIGHIVYTLEHQYHQAIAREVVDYGKKMYNAKVIVLDGQANNEKTLSAVENLLSQKVQSISLHNPDSGLTTTAIKMARAKGVSMVTTLIYPSEKIAPHVQPMEAPSSFTMGALCATKWLEANPGTTCQVAILDFGGFEQVEVLRTGPFFAGVKSIDPNAVLVAQLNGQGSTVKSMEITLDILQGNPQVNIIFGANDEMGLGALAACEQIGRGKMNNGKPITEIIAGLDGNISALLKVYDPSSSFKMTHGAVRDNARAVVDTMIAMIDGKIDSTKYQETQVLSRVVDFYNTPIEEAQRFLEENFFYEGDLKDDVQKAMR